MTEYVYKVAHGIEQSNDVDIQRNPRLVKKLKAKVATGGTIGVIAGRFSPFHTGHMAVILRAAKQVSHLVVVVDSASSEKLINDKSNHVTLSPRRKYRYVTEELRDYEHISVVGINEDCLRNSSPVDEKGKIVDYEKDFVSWWNLIKAAVGNVPITHYFSSEADSYKSKKDGIDLFEKYVGDETTHIIIDPKRSATNISGTEIREDHNKNWEFIPDSLKEIYAKKVCIIGAPSNGKSNITKYLAQVFGTSYVSETGGEFYRDIGDWEDLDLKEDFLKFASQQYLLELEALRNSNKVIFTDTSFETTVNFYKGRFNMWDKTDPILDYLNSLNEENPADIYINIESQLPFNPEYRMEQKLCNDLHQKLLDSLGGMYININGSEEENYELILKIVLYITGQLVATQDEMAEFICSFSKVEQDLLNSVPRINNKRIIKLIANEAK